MSNGIKKPILIVDDDEMIRKQMKWALGREYEVLLAGDRQTALEICEENRPGVVTLDLGLPPDPDGSTEGMRALAEILRIGPHAKIIVVTGNPEKQNALKAVEQGAYDFQQKPVNVDELKIVLRRAYNLYALEQEVNALRVQKEQEHAFEGIIGESAPMKNIFVTIEKIATSDTSVLITGESGVGKELIAKAIHAHSLRARKPFIPINCAAIPETLLESELFGYERGAFTGAQRQKVGKFERAHEGTLFLDEVGDLGQPLQAKLLRFLQDQVIERVGGKTPIQVDVRVLAATNRNLEDDIRQGRFREDLYFRLNEIHIVAPPLRLRENDTLLLAKKFLHEFALENNRSNIKGFTDQASTFILEYPWPGNVRELRSRVKRAVVMTDSALITPADLDLVSARDLPSTKDLVSTPPTTLKEAREKLEAKLIAEALARNKGNISHAAKELDVTRPTLHDLLKKYNLSKAAVGS